MEETSGKKLSNLDVLRELHADILMKMRAMRPLIAAELGVTVGEVGISTMCSSTYESVYLHVGDRCTSVINRSLGPQAVDEVLARYRQDITIPSKEVGDA